LSSSGHLVDLFKSMFHSHRLIDVQPDTLALTWQNGRSGSDSIAKRLDIFLVSEDLLLEVSLYRSWVEFPYVSDHAPILLQLENTSLQKVHPFRFHSQWLAEKYFNDIVYKLWKDPKYLKEGDSKRRFG